MNTFINYLIELNLGLVFFYTVYVLLFRNETQFTTKRWFLLVSILGSLLFPLFTITGTQNGIIPTLSNTIPAYWLPEIVILGHENAAIPEVSTNYWSWITPAYLGVAIFLILLLLIRVGKIVWLFNKAKRYSWKTYTVAESDRVHGIFSFFHYIFLSGGHQIDAAEKEEILQHEAVHIQKGHSFDIMLINLLQAVCWFNPIIRYYKISLVQVHEFEADARSVESMDVDRYCGLLAKVTLQQNGFVLANHFTNSFTLKRINMMKTVRRKMSQWKIASAVLMLALYFVVVACQDQVMADVKEMGQNSSIALDYPPEVQSKLVELKASNPNDEFIVIEMNEEGKKKLEALDADRSIATNIKEMNVVKSADQTSYIILVKGEKVNALSEITKTEDGVFTVVDESAEPANGMEDFYKFIATHLKYPQQARELGVEGRVFIEFIVNEDGSISDVKPVKGIGAGCDLEAVRVITMSASWKPAKQEGKIVRQRLVVPITFKLG